MMKYLDCKHLNRTQCPAAFINIDGCSDFIPKTNGDRLRAMSNEELNRLNICPKDLDYNFVCNFRKPCGKCLQDWLNSPAESIESRGECDLNREANAALIAAAPEMYRKLEWLQREFDESDDEELVAIGWEIELILKKARGER